MNYVLDSGFFVIARDYYPDTFPSFWENLSEFVRLERISSVDEVRSEIENYGGEQRHLLDWVRTNKHIFTEPSDKEQRYVTQILDNYPKLIEKKRLENKPFADPFVIAKAIVRQDVVITSELPAIKSKGIIQGAPHMPDICEDYEIRCITTQKFLAEQEWSF